jgi:hypothetical protein
VDNACLRSPPVSSADCAGNRAGARVIQRSLACATWFRGSFYVLLKLPLTVGLLAWTSNSILCYVLTWRPQSLIAALRCRYSQAPSSRHTYQPRSWIGARQKPLLLGPGSVACTAAACRERSWPIELPPSWFRFTTACSVLAHLCTSVIHFSAGLKVKVSILQPPEAWLRASSHGIFARGCSSPFTASLAPLPFDVSGYGSGDSSLTLYPDGSSKSHGLVNL